MQFFRMRLILALVVGITLVSVASTYFEVLAHKHTLRLELQRRTAWLSKSLQSDMGKAVAGGQTAEIAADAARSRVQDQALGLAVFDARGKLVTEAGPKRSSHRCRAARWTRQSTRVLTHPSLATWTISNGWRK